MNQKAARALLGAVIVAAYGPIAWHIGTLPLITIHIVLSVLVTAAAVEVWLDGRVRAAQETSP